MSLQCFSIIINGDKSPNFKIDINLRGHDEHVFRKACQPHDGLCSWDQHNKTLSEILFVLDEWLVHYAAFWWISFTSCISIISKNCPKISSFNFNYISNDTSQVRLITQCERINPTINHDLHEFALVSSEWHLTILTRTSVFEQTLPEFIKLTKLNYVENNYLSKSQVLYSLVRVWLLWIISVVGREWSEYDSSIRHNIFSWLMQKPTVVDSSKSWNEEL